MTMGLVGMATVGIGVAPWVGGGAPDAPDPTPAAVADTGLDEPAKEPGELVATPVDIARVQASQAAGTVVDLVFVVDTTSSMGGLLEGAKATIWQILDTVVSQQPQPAVRVGVVAYRDRGDAYVTHAFGLSDDLDAAHAFVKALRPDGGGDGPESMARALQEAVDDLAWTTSADAHRMVFVVADAPDHAYPDEAAVDAIAARGRARGLVVHGILAGNDGQAQTDLERIARAGGGDFFAVPQDGGAEAIATPFDTELDAAEHQLAATGLAYQNADGRSYQAKIEANKRNSLAVRASRRSTLSKQGAGVVSGAGDLIQDLLGGRSLTEVPVSDLPVAYQQMTPAERADDAARRLEERSRWTATIEELTSKRDAWLVQERRRRRAAGTSGFDAAVERATVARMRRP
jgi:hypothetical protein